MSNCLGIPHIFGYLIVDYSLWNRIANLLSYFGARCLGLGLSSFLVSTLPNLETISHR